MSELEAASLQDAYSTLPGSKSDDPGEPMRDYIASVTKVLTSVRDDLTTLNPLFKEMIVKFSESYAAALPLENAYAARATAEDDFVNVCEAQSMAFSEPRRLLQRLDAIHFIYRPIKLTDYKTDDAFILQSFANEYKIEVQRQFHELEEVDGDRKEFIAIFNGNVEQFVVAEMAEWPKFDESVHNDEADALRLLVESVNRFASQRFEFYRELSGILGRQQLTAGSDQLASRYQRYFEAAIAVLRKKKDAKLRFKIFGSDLLSNLIVRIEENKTKLLGQLQAEQTDETLLTVYRSLYNQITFAVSSMSNIFHFALNLH